MVRDFTITAFRELLRKFADEGYTFKSCRDYYDSPSVKTVFLRHDVDKLPGNSLVTSQIENEAGITGTYYFRSFDGRFEEETIRQISKLGHEIGYHYEDLDVATRKSKLNGRQAKGNEEDEIAAIAADSFMKNLKKLRNIVHVDTVCMHGNPMSPVDNRVLWKYYDYGTMGIVAEPYFDFSLESMLYLTDTGRRWDGSSVSVRDRIYTRDEGFYSQWKRKPLPGSSMLMTEKSTRLQKRYKFRETGSVLQAISSGNLPEQLMITFHPQRWCNSTLPWLREYLWQNSKNAIKYFVIKNI